MLVGQLGGAFVLACVQAVVYLLVGFATGVDFASGAAGSFVLLALRSRSPSPSPAWAACSRCGSAAAKRSRASSRCCSSPCSSARRRLPRNLIKADMVPRHRDLQPGLLPDRGDAQPGHQGWNAQALELAFGFSFGLALISLALARPRDAARGWHEHEALPLRGARRRLALGPQHGRQPGDHRPLGRSSRCSSWSPSRAGSRASATCRTSTTSPGYTSFQFVFVFLQSAAFGGVFTGFAVARDFESGFARRLLLPAPQRSGIIAGYAVGALVRWAHHRRRS